MRGFTNTYAIKLVCNKGVIKDIDFDTPACQGVSPWYIPSVSEFKSVYPLETTTLSKMNFYGAFVSTMYFSSTFVYPTFMDKSNTFNGSTNGANYARGMFKILAF